MPTYKVVEGQELIHSGVRYSAGSVAPDGVAAEALCSVGVLVLVDGQQAPAAAPAAEPASSQDGPDPSSIRSVPLRSIRDVLAEIDDEGLLREMLAADNRSGGRSAIRERIQELGRA